MHPAAGPGDIRCGFGKPAAGVYLAPPRGDRSNGCAVRAPSGTVEYMTQPNLHPQPSATWAADATARSNGKGRFGREVGYLLSGLPLGTAAFVLLVTGFALGAGTLILLFGVFVLGGALSVARFFARVEAAQIAHATGRALPPPADGPRRGGWGLLADAQGWRDLVHAIVAFPVRVATFALTLVWLCAGLGGTTYGLWSWSIPRDEYDGWIDLAFGWSGTGADILGNTTAGLFFLLTSIPVIHGLALTQSGLGRVLLRGGRL